MNKRIISLIMAFALICNFTGCQKEEKKSENILRVGVIKYTRDDPFINALTQKFKDNLKSMENENLKIIVSEKSGDDSQRDQNEVVEEMIDAGCDIMCVNLVDRTAPGRIIKLARQNNIPIVFFNREPVKEDLMQWNKLYYIGCDAEQSGQMQGQIVSNYIKLHKDVDKNKDGKIQYVLLEGEAGHQDAISRTDCSVKTIINNEINLEKLTYQFADWNRAQAQNRISQLIKQYGDGIELIISNNDEMALGAVEAYKQSKYSKEQWPVIFGIDGLNDALLAIKNGQMQGTVYNDKEDQSMEMARLTVDIFKGEGLGKHNLKDGKYYVSQYREVDINSVDDLLER